MSASLEGIQLGPDSGASWTLISGTAPHQVSIRMDKAAALALYESKLTTDLSKGGSPWVTLQIGAKKIKYLMVLGTSPTDSPHESLVTLTDLRWIWARKWVKRSYNVRRRTGSTKDVGGGENLANLQRDLDFQPWSLKEGRPWTATEVLRDVFFFAWGGFGSRDFLTIDSGASDLPIIEDLEIDSPGDVAIGRMLAALGGGMSCYINPETGSVHVYDLHDGSESELLGVSAPGKTTTKDKSGLPMVVGYPVFSFRDRKSVV